MLTENLTGTSFRDIKFLTDMIYISTATSGA